MRHETDCPVCGRAIGKPWLSERYPGDPTKLIISACSQACLDRTVEQVNGTIKNLLETLKQPIEPQYFYIKPVAPAPITEPTLAEVQAELATELRSIIAAQSQTIEAQQNQIKSLTSALEQATVVRKLF